MTKRKNSINVAMIVLAFSLLAPIFLLAGCNDKSADNSSTNTSMTNPDSDTTSADSPATPKKGPKRNKIKSLAGGEDGPSRGFQDN